MLATLSESYDFIIQRHVCCVCHRSPLTCKDLLQPLDELGPNDVKSEWAMLAGSLRVTESDEPSYIPDSISLHFYNSNFTKGNLYGELCHYLSHDVLIKGAHCNFTAGQMSNFSGTIFNTSCPDCVWCWASRWSHQVLRQRNCACSAIGGEVDEKVLKEWTAFVHVIHCLQLGACET